MRAIALAIILGLGGVEIAIKTAHGLPSNFATTDSGAWIYGLTIAVFLFCLILGI